MRPLRRKKRIEVADDLSTGQERILGLAEEMDFLGRRGSVDTLETLKWYFRDCGHAAPPGGRCAECGAIVCAPCLGRCSACGKSLCPAHLTGCCLSGQSIPVCGSCKDRLVRRQRLAQFARSLFSPFIRFKD